MIFVTLHDRIGISIHSGEGLFHTRAGITGELGHVVVQPGGAICECGKPRLPRDRGKHARDHGKSHEHPCAQERRSQCRRIDDRRVAEGGTGRAENRPDWQWRRLPRALGGVLANVINVIGIDNLVIKSPLMASEVFITALKALLESNCIYPLNKRITIRAGATDEYAGAAGAAWLVLRERFACPLDRGRRIT